MKEIKLNHVLGNQDKKKPYKDLKTQEKLDVKENEAADIHMGTYDHVNKGQLITPAKLQIIIRNKKLK